MKNIVILIFVVTILGVLGCNNSLTPYSGVYELPNSRISAIVIDSSVCILYGLDTAYFYDLHLIEEIYLPELMNEDEKLFILGMTYSSSLTRMRYEHIECKIDFQLDKSYGNSLTAVFQGNQTAIIGGLNFNRPEENKESERIFQNYQNILTNNLQYQMMMN